MHSWVFASQSCILLLLDATDNVGKCYFAQFLFHKYNLTSNNVPDTCCQYNKFSLNIWPVNLHCMLWVMDAVSSIDVVSSVVTVCCMETKQFSRPSPCSGSEQWTSSVVMVRKQIIVLLNFAYAFFREFKETADLVLNSCAKGKQEFQQSLYLFCGCQNPSTLSQER